MTAIGSGEPHGRYLLDTNIVIALFRGETGVVAALRTAAAVFVPAVVLGELYFGARKSVQSTANLARIAEFADEVAVLPSDAGTAGLYGETKAQLRLRGRPIPENDLWIAALARQHQLTLATRDLHFDAVAAVELVRW